MNESEEQKHVNRVRQMILLVMQELQSVDLSANHNGYRQQTIKRIAFDAAPYGDRYLTAAREATERVIDCLMYRDKTV